MQKLVHLETVYLLCINALTFKHNMQLVSNNFYFLIFKWYVHILFPKLFWPIVRKKCSSDRENLEAKLTRRRICKFFEITKTIYLQEKLEKYYVLQGVPHLHENH